jgi:hypothetical protein
MAAADPGPFPVVWEGYEVGTFEFLANDSGQLFGYWTPAAGPRLRPFLKAVRAGRRPRVWLDRRAAGGQAFTVCRIEAGRRQRGPEESLVELIVLGSGMAASKV